jgi:tetratricopeptide (TPR) repeat protein
MARPVDESCLEAVIEEAGQLRKSTTSPTISHAELPPEQLNALVTLYQKGQLEEVVRQATAKALEFPNAATLYNMLGTAKAGLRDLDEAIASFRKAVEIKPHYVEAHNNLGLALQRRGRFEEAIASFNSALRIKADYAEAHNNLGAALKHQGHLEEAVASLQRAICLAPDLAEAHNNLGIAMQIQGRLDEAIASFSRAVQIKPRFVEAHCSLCGIYERQNRLGDFEKALEAATLNCGKDDSNILLRLAQLASRKNQFEDALGYLKKARAERILPSQRQPYFGLLGKICDKLGRFDEAFSAFLTHNELAAASAEAKTFNADRHLKSILSQKAEWASSAKPAWASSTSRLTSKSPVFLVGFPRSGTTLLDTILRSHAQITVVEEGPMVGVVVGVMSKAFGRRPTVQDLTALSEVDLVSLREIYFKELRIHLERADDSKLVVDRFALNILDVDIIHRLFPNAKFILALRHPCDCVLSCFMQTFKLNDAMANFLSLDQSAKFYAAVMELWSLRQQKLELDVHVLKYEDLVQDFAVACKSLIGFLGMDWDENLRNYQRTALERSRINTPSYNQVTQPLYMQAVSRWTNYRTQMEPVLPLLRPWIEEFGY